MPNEVLYTAKKVPERRAGRPRATLPRPSLQGDLSQIGVTTLLTLIEMERKSGILICHGPGGRSAWIFVRAGRVVHARLDETPQLVDAECVYYLLAWTVGVFELIVCNIKGADRVQTATMNLLLEGARRLDEVSYKVAL